MSFALFGIDKISSKIGTRFKNRIPEVYLHLASLIGGGAGSIMGMITFNHKIKKVRFLIIQSLVIVFNPVIYHYLTSDNELK